MFPNILNQNKQSKSLVGTELDTDLTKRNYTTYVPKEVLENEIYNHNRPFVEMPHDIDLTFAQNYIEKDGRFVYCTSQTELIEKLSNFFTINNLTTAFIWEEEVLALLKSSETASSFKIERVIDHAKVAISNCESLIADEGTIVINSNQNRFRTLEVFPEYHIILASKKHVKINIEHAVSDFIIKHPDIFPFIIDIAKEERNTRFALNKPVLISRGTKNVIIFYCEECSF
jgi:L-lactate dehydrogenase complex protein LldG